MQRADSRLTCGLFLPRLASLSPLAGETLHSAPPPSPQARRRRRDLRAQPPTVPFQWPERKLASYFMPNRTETTQTRSWRPPHLQHCQRSAISQPASRLPVGAQAAPKKDCQPVGSLEGWLKGASLPRAPHRHKGSPVATAAAAGSRKLSGGPGKLISEREPFDAC